MNNRMIISKKIALPIIVLLMCLLLIGCTGNDIPPTNDNTSAIDAVVSTTELESGDVTLDEATEINGEQKDDFVYCGDLENGRRWFLAEVMDGGLSIMVMPLDPNSFEGDSAGSAGIWVRAGSMDVSKYQGGDIVYITYNGLIAASWPCQISYDIFEKVNLSEFTAPTVSDTAEATSVTMPLSRKSTTNTEEDEKDYYEYIQYSFDTKEWSVLRIPKDAYADVKSTWELFTPEERAAMEKALQDSIAEREAQQSQTN